MPKRKRRKVGVGANPHLIAHASLSRLVLKDHEFVAFRRRILEPLLRWVVGDDLLVSFKFMRDVPAAGSPMANLFAEIRRAARRYRYDEMDEGEWVFFQMVVTGKTPELRDVGAGPAYEWKPIVYLPAGEDFESVMRQVHRLLQADWPRIEAAWTDRRWAETIPMDEIERYVEWFFKVTVERRSQDLVAEDSSASDRTVRRGIRIVRRLLGISARRGRPPK